MRFLLDENLHEATAAALTAVGALSGDTFLHISDLGSRGAQDEDIPSLCRENRVDALITANVRDFGARKVHFQALLAAGVSVVVVRPGNIKFTPEKQVGLISTHLDRIRTLLSTTQEVLIRVTPTQAEPRALDDLLTEFGAR